MISRRNAIKLGAAGVYLPSIGDNLPTRSPLLAAEQISAYQFGPSLDKPIVLKWTFETGAERAPSPVAGNGLTYIGGGNGWFYALDTKSGSTRWAFETGGPINSSAVLDGGVVYFGSYDGSFSAVDANTGALKWTFLTIARAGFSITPVLDGDIIYASSFDTRVYAIETSTGQERWNFFTGQELEAPPLVIENSILVLSNSGDSTPIIYNIDAQTGEERWRLDFKRKFVTSLSVENGTLYFGNWDSDGVSERDGSYYAIEVATGLIRWESRSEEVSKAAATADLVFFGDGDYVMAKSTSDGNTVWTRDLDGYWSTPLIIEDMVLVGRLDELLALEMATGETRWGAPNDTVVGTPILADGIVYGKGTELVACDAITGMVYWTYPLDFDMKFTRQTPTVMDGTVYAEQLGLIYAFGNITIPLLIEDTVVRASPSSSGVERGTLPGGAEITTTGSREERNDQLWIEVEASGTTGWIPLGAIDPATLPPEGEIVYVYVP